jgi:hypothetical protein
MKELRGRGLPRPEPDDPSRLSPDQPVWEVEGRVRALPPAPERRSGRSRRPLAVALALGLFAAGIAVGSMLAGGSRQPALRATAATTSVVPTTTEAPTTTVRARQVSPPACLSAVDDADAVISYLVANMRDHRLARSLQQYQAASRNCRRAR